MKLKDLLREIVPTRLLGDDGQEVTGICYDSRKAAPGSLFVAIKGFQSDGHAYIPKALAQGACALLVQVLQYFKISAGSCYSQRNSISSRLMHISSGGHQYFHRLGILLFYGDVQQRNIKFFAGKISGSHKFAEFNVFSLPDK